MGTDYLCYALGGLFLTNAIPHLVSGVQGRRFQSPFAKPPGRGLSSPALNVIWGAMNLAAGYALLRYVGSFDIAELYDALALGAGVLVSGVLLANYFGQFHGKA